MDFQAIGTFTLMVMLLTIMPGPNGALLLKTVPQNGHHAGILNLAGIVTAFSIHGLFSILGLSAVILNTSQAFFIVKLLGSLYLLYLGVTSLGQAIFSKHSSSFTTTTKHESKKTVIRQNKRLFLEGFLTNLLNPKASMFYLAAFPQFISLEGNPIFESIILVGIHSLIVVIWFSFIIFAIGNTTRALSSLKFKRIVQGATGSVMLWFGYRLLIFQEKS
jgi:threonine/homoserine/homoserine lactone efflux protein